ncbi:hypothetical protein [Paludisphaera rhizosphaerae]|uniref:hypothetical protein n=1 Tax=Paludisphaera rhizosphaerae TaxID=2711216 RepID=UPI0013ECD9EC|nr:hypothetical protein [Paludisphaera rhizosphaerae]
MGTMLAYVLLIAAILPLSALLAPPENDEYRTYRAGAVVVLALGVLFFALGSVHPVDAPGAWAFRIFYGSLCLATAVVANLLTFLEQSNA